MLVIFFNHCCFRQCAACADNKEQLIALTPEWKGERFADGRPKVPDNIMKRMKAVSVEEAWAAMKNAGYGYQVAEGWEVIKDSEDCWKLGE